MGTTADKLQRLVEGKQAIINAVNSKANTSLTINSKLSDVASAISNISGSGTNTSDATAVADDILKGKTAYTADGKVEGTIETYNGENVSGIIIDDMLQTRIDTTNSCNYLFYYYTGSNVDFISRLDTSNVASMSQMFYYCSALTTIPQLNTRNVTNMSYMFYSCEKLVTIPQLDTSNVIDMGGMFRSCSGLTTIPQLNTRKVTSLTHTFRSCSKLTTIDITYYNISNTTYGSYFVNGCYRLKALIIRSFGNYTTNSNAFENCYWLLGTANSSYNPNGEQGYVYVPRNMVSTLQSATNWSVLQFRALEDYTVDGTTTGVLDENKI